MSEPSNALAGLVAVVLVLLCVYGAASALFSWAVSCYRHGYHPYGIKPGERIR